ncbi:PRD domain-containing protein [Erysipelotrichaceae bacterium HCN-30851]
MMMSKRSGNLLNSVKNEVLRCIIKNSENYSQTSLKGCTASTISKKLNISRSLASYYLNQLYEEKLLVKITSRPVYYLHKKTIEELYQTEINSFDFLSIDEFERKVGYSNEILSDFSKIIGYEGSMKECISRIISAISYPPKGVPFIIYGESGVGKRELIEAMYDYGIKHHFFCSKTKLHFVNLNYENSIANKELSEYIQTKNLENCILCIFHAENLNYRSLEKIQEILGKENIQSGFMLIICTEKNPLKIFTREFLHYFPMIVNVPSLSQRPLEEREELVKKYLKAEEKRVGKQVYISFNAFRLLCQSEYSNNRIDLEKTIKMCCIQSANYKDNMIEIRRKNLPFLSGMEDFCINDNENKIVSLNELNIEHIDEKLLKTLDVMLELSKNDKESFTDYMRAMYLILKDYFDKLLFADYYTNSNIDMLEKIFKNIVVFLNDKYQIILPTICCKMMARLVDILNGETRKIKQWKDINIQEVENLLQQIFEELPKEEMIIKKASQLFKAQSDFNLNEIEILIFLIYVYQFSNLGKKSVLGVIVSHGYATASSICDAANTMLEEYVFDSIDMPLDTSNKETVNRIENFIRQFALHRPVIVLVDMGSLEMIGEHIGEIIKEEIGLISNVSTKLALEVGMMIKQGIQIKEIVKKAVSNNQITSTYYDKRKKENAILFVSEGGENIANQMLKLFEMSLPVKVDIALLTYSFTDLRKYKEDCPIFREYQVLFVIGTMNPDLNYISFIPLEEIIDGSEQNLSLNLGKFLDESQLSTFKDNVLVHFSLTNVMENITILNPNKLLESVVESIRNLENYFKIKLSRKDKLGLYIHISCLIERLVTKNDKDEEINLEKFEDEKKEFIQGISLSFSNLTEHYRVQIPTIEILYIYEYVTKNKEDIKRYCEK